MDVYNDSPACVTASEQRPSIFVSRYEANLAGRDFALGDVHGEFELLDNLLEEARFDPQVDRIFSTGDLVDRGPSSISVVPWLFKPWFKAVRGNHEQWCIEGGLDAPVPAHARHGGAWFYLLKPEERSAIAKFLNTLPVAIEVVGCSGELFGVVHAECPMYRWQHFVEALQGYQGNSIRDHYITEALWRRTRFDSQHTHSVRGVSKVYVGHTVVPEVTTLGNVVYLDTGGCFADGQLTMVEMGGAETIFSVSKV